MSQGARPDEPGQQIIDFTAIRKKRLEQKRRKTERIFFKSLLGATSVEKNGKTHKIEVIDLSEEGISFQIPVQTRDIWPSEPIFPIRLYFSGDTYLEILVQIQNSNPVIDGHSRFVRYGCSVDTTTQSYRAFELFVKFLNIYAEQAHRDQGSKTVFYL